MTNCFSRTSSRLRSAKPLRGVPAFVPKGLNDRSLAIYCQGCVKNEVRPVGHGVIGNSRLVYHAVPHSILDCVIQTVPTGRVALLGVSQAMNCLATIILLLRGDTPALPDLHHCPASFAEP